VSYVPADKTKLLSYDGSKAKSVLPREAERIISGASKVVAIAVTM
jgi:hypothetical protein